MATIRTRLHDAAGRIAERTGIGTQHPDLTFYHPPSVYDFRDHPAVFGPISDVIPSSPVFEMYPIGLTSIADYLESRGYDVRIVNLANGMLADPEYDPEREIRRSRARCFGIDLHWLPHAHGAIEVARLVKRHHPDRPVIVGGLSATYFHEELIEYDAVDYVVRGDSTEEPVLQLLRAIDGEREFADVDNLTWQREGETVVNPLEFVPSHLDYVSLPAYEYVIRSVVKYGSLKKTLPYRDWLDDPMTLLLLSRGCARECTFCGGSAVSYEAVCNRDRPAFRSPEQLLQDVRKITSFSRGPIFVVHDLRMAGSSHAREFLHLLEGADVDNTFVFELFGPADEEFFAAIDRAVPNYSLQLSVESHDPAVREAVGKFACPNEDLEATLEAALENGCASIDLFFMVGLPKQTYEVAVGDVAYSRELLERIDGDRIHPFTAPLAPFLDPGSPGFEDPERFGYRVHAETLAEHRELLVQPSWKYMLSYETEWLDRDGIVEATYDAAFGMNELKREFDLLDEDSYLEVKDRLTRSKEVVERVDDLVELPAENRRRTLQRLREEFEDVDEYSICGEGELTWHNDGFRNALSLLHLGFRVLRTGGERPPEGETPSTRKT